MLQRNNLHSILKDRQFVETLIWQCYTPAMEKLQFYQSVKQLEVLNLKIPTNLKNIQVEKSQAKLNNKWKYLWKRQPQCRTLALILRTNKLQKALSSVSKSIITLEKGSLWTILHLSTTEADGSKQFYYPDTNSQWQQISSIQYFAMLPPFSVWILIWYTAHRNLFLSLLIRQFRWESPASYDYVTALTFSKKSAKKLNYKTPMMIRIIYSAL